MLDNLNNEETCHGGIIFKERITVLMEFKANGLEKFQTLVIGK